MEDNDFEYGGGTEGSRALYMRLSNLGDANSTSNKSWLDLSHHSIDRFSARSTDVSSETRKKVLKLPAGRQRSELDAPCNNNHWYHGWIWDFLAWILGTVLLAMIILLLTVFDQKLLSAWNSKISINTIVSALSQGAVSALLLPVSDCIGQLKWVWFQKSRRVRDLEAFELASRGPAGSLMYLRNPSHLPTLATVGALVTVLMLGFQPFTQQAVDTNGLRWENSQLEATINRATQFNDTDLLGLSANSPFSSDSSLADAAAKGLAGDDNAASQVLGNCPSSNCTWSEYNSLAFCFSVEDVSSTIISNCTNKQNSISNSDHTFDYFDTECNVTTQALRDLYSVGYAGQGAISTPWQNFGIFEMEAAFSVAMLNVGRNASSRNVTTLESNTSLTDAVIWSGVILYSQQTPENSSTRPCGNDSFCASVVPPPGQIALNFNISICSQSMTTTMTNGTTNTDVVDGQNELHWDISVYNGVAQAKASDGNVMYLIDEDSVSRFTGFLDDSNYNTRAQVLADSSPTTYSGIVPLDQPGNVVLTETRGIDGITAMAKAMLGAEFNTFDASSALKNVQYRLSNITTSMTNSLRTQASVGGTKSAIGDAWHLENFIQVDYRWLIVPLFLWLLVTILFAGTVYWTTHSGAPRWKSSLLAVLRLADNQGAPASLKEIERDAKAAEAWIEYRDGTWRFSGPNFDATKPA